MTIFREGAMPTTSQVNPEQAKAAFEPLLKEGKDILHLAFSSGLSGSCQSAGSQWKSCRMSIRSVKLS